MAAPTEVVQAASDETTGSTSIGIIIPPPTRKAIIDRTVAYVAKNGRHVEEEILSRPQAQNAANFTFLLEDSPFHAYYLAKLDELQRGAPPPAPPETQPAKAPEQSQPQQSQQPATSITAAPSLRATGIVDALRASSKRKGQEPSAFEFLLDRPAEITPLMNQLVKLTAEFAATDGRKFESDIYNKEKNNHEFAFLNNDHPHHAYYVDLVRAYRKIMEGSSLGWISKLALDENVLLERAVHRFGHRREEALKRMETDEKRALERNAFLEIDWHDFVVVETIRFDEDVSPSVPHVATSSKHQAAMDDDEIGEIRKDYVVEPVRATITVPMAVLSDGRRVPVSEMNEHIKVNLMDPKWRENQDKFESRQRDSNLAEGGSIQKNLRRLAGARPDVFGGETEETERRLEERKRRKEAEVVVWDGNLLNANQFKAAAQSIATSVPPRSSVEMPSILSSVPPPAPLPPGASGFVAPPPVPRVPGFTASPPIHAPPGRPVDDAPEPKRAKLAESADSSVLVMTVVIPDGGPNGIQPRDVAISAKKTLTVSEFKELLSSTHLNGIAAGKFQLKTGEGRFLKNTEMVESLNAATALELKWKLK